ncbi:ribosomal RNA large subunit methyltransferase H, partial [Striga asiatica]
MSLIRGRQLRRKAEIGQQIPAIWRGHPAAEKNPDRDPASVTRHEPPTAEPEPGSSPSESRPLFLRLKEARPSRRSALPNMMMEMIIRASPQYKKILAELKKKEADEKKRQRTLMKLNLFLIDFEKYGVRLANQIIQRLGMDPDYDMKVH